jgi:uncharacterized membrane protein
MARWQLLLAGGGVAAYALLSHQLMLHGAASSWAVAAILGPLLAAVAAMAWRARQWWLLAVVAAAVAGLAQLVARGGVREVSLLYVLQHVGTHAVLGLSFAHTLRGPGLSMIGRFASQLHPLTPAMVAYTRRVTWVWVAYFFGMAALSLAVYLLGPWAAWSLLANVGTPLAVGLLFIGEYGLRYRLHPEFDRMSLADAVRAARGMPAKAGP